MKPTIGILGGMGPRATVAFEQLLLERLGGNDQDLPRIVSVNDGSIPDRSSYLLGRGQDPLPQMLHGLRVLEYAGSSVICVPCNTACALSIFTRLQRRTTVPILNLPVEVGRALVASGMQSIYLLATEGTIKTGVYQSVCAQVGVRCTVPNRRVQALVSQVIAAVKANDLPTARLAAVSVQAAIVASGCPAVLLGCTELPLVASALVPNGCEAVDTLAVLADACVRYTKNELLETTI